MRNILKNAILKKILIVFAIIVMVTNFIVPNYVYAFTGEKLVSSILYLLSYVGDAVIQTLQYIIIGYDEVKDSKNNWSIKYSPGMIFSNELGMLRINFVTAEEDDIDPVEMLDYPNSDDDLKEFLKRMNDVIGEMKSTDNDPRWNLAGAQGYFTKDDSGNYKWNPRDSSRTLESFGLELDNEGHWTLVKEKGQYKGEIKTKVDIFLKITGGAKNHGGVKDADIENLWPNNAVSGVNRLVYCYDEWLYVVLTENASSDDGTTWQVPCLGSENDMEIVRYHLSLIQDDNVEQESIAYELKNNISKWYVALRTIAIVGMLSVLLYIGIQIILKSTSAQDKAKYKNILKDWLVALCLLFMLHYLMAFMTEFTDDISNVIRSNVIQKDIDNNKYDKLMSEIRAKYEDINDDSAPSRVEDAWIYGNIFSISNTNSSIYNTIFKKGSIYGFSNDDSPNDMFNISN